MKDGSNLKLHTYAGSQANNERVLTVSGGNSNWFHVATTYEVVGSDTRITSYINGVQASQQTIANYDFSAHSRSNNYIGRSNWAEADFKGQMADVVIDDQAFSSNSIKSLYDGNRPDYNLTKQELDNLQLTPTGHSDDDFTLTYSVITGESENSTTFITTATQQITVTAVADAPTARYKTVNTNEDVAVALSFDPCLTDRDGSESITHIIVSGVSNATLSAGVKNSNLWTLTDAQLASLILTPKEDSHNEYTLTYQVYTKEDRDNSTAVSSFVQRVNVQAVTDTASLKVVSPTTYQEDVAGGYLLSFSATTTDIDGSETITKLIVDVGTLTNRLNAGTNNSTLWTVTQTQLAGLRLQALDHSDADQKITISAYTQDVEGANTYITSKTIDVKIEAVTDDMRLYDGSIYRLETISSGDRYTNVPDLVVGSNVTRSVGGYSFASGAGNVTFSPKNYLSTAKDFAIALTVKPDANTTAGSTIDFAKYDDGGNGGIRFSQKDKDLIVTLNGSVQITYSNVFSDVTTPKKFMFSYNNTSKGYQLYQDGVALQPKAGSSSQVTLNPITANTLFSLGNSFEGRLNDVRLYDRQVSLQEARQYNRSVITLLEDSDSYGLSIHLGFVDNDGSESIQSIIINAPAHVKLSAGNVSGTNWTLTQSQLAGLRASFTDHNASNFALNLTVNVKDTEEGVSRRFIHTQDYNIEEVADTASLSVATISMNISEDVVINLSIMSSLTDVDGSESITILINHVPAGARLSSGTVTSGVWTLTTAQLHGLRLTPILDNDESMRLGITALTVESDDGGSGRVSSALISRMITINMVGVAETASISVNAVTTQEDKPVALNIKTSTTDVDGSETIEYVVVKGVPAGARLNKGDLLHLEGGLSGSIPTNTGSSSLSGITSTGVTSSSNVAITTGGGSKQYNTYSFAGGANNTSNINLGSNFRIASKGFTYASWVKLIALQLMEPAFMTLVMPMVLVIKVCFL